jgi:DNA-binding transcriptional LysR family regulator
LGWIIVPDLDTVAVFVKVVQAGSFSRAAKQLGMPNSTVSAHVSRLEKRLGITLLQRTTRRLRLTEGGESYFRLAAQAVDDLASAEASIGAAQAEPQGTLRITAPADIATDWFSELTADFRRQYPKVDIEFVFADQVLDMLAERIDVALRAGNLRDSRLVARRVGFGYWMLFASPSYLRKAGMPSHPRQLRGHSLLQFTKLGREHWRLGRRSSVITIPLPRNVLANDATLVRRLALAGNGIALLPIHMCREDVRAGRLVRVLPEWVGKTDPVHLIYVSQKFVPAKVRAFVDYAANSIQRVFGPAEN